VFAAPRHVGSGYNAGFMGSLLIPVVLLGGAERLAHLLQILLVCLAILETVKLIRGGGLN